MGHYKDLAMEFAYALIEKGDERDFDTIFNLVTTFDTEESKAFWKWYDQLDEMT